MDARSPASAQQSSVVFRPKELRRCARIQELRRNSGPLRRNSMQAKLPFGVVDPHDHHATREAAWLLERSHLQAQLRRERARSATRAKLKVADSKVRRQVIAQAWQKEDVVHQAEQQKQLGVAEQESQTRTAEAVKRAVDVTLKQEGHTELQRSLRELVEERDHAADRLAQRQGVQRWRTGMYHGRRLLEFEFEEAARQRSVAKRGFRWAKEDETHDEELDRTTGSTRLTSSRLAVTLLPTSPKPGGVKETYSPGVWRPGSQSMSPGAWRHQQLDAQVEVAKSAAMKDHLKARRQYNQRQNAINAYLDNWANSGHRVASARYRAWRLKVDHRKAPTDPAWPDKSTHRVSSPVPPSRPRSATGERTRIDRRQSSAPSSPRSRAAALSSPRTPAYREAPMTPRGRPLIAISY